MADGQLPAQSLRSRNITAKRERGGAMLTVPMLGNRIFSPHSERRSLIFFLQFENSLKTKNQCAFVEIENALSYWINFRAGVVEWQTRRTQNKPAQPRPQRIESTLRTTYHL